MLCGTYATTQDDHERPPEDFEPSGSLRDGRSSQCHGVGCAVRSTKGRTVDFDFGENGEINGFSIPRLLPFVADRPAKFGFASREEVCATFDDAIEEFHFSGCNLYYLR